MSSIGMMDPAFFVGRKEIVDWVNETLGLTITKIEDTAFGAIACQVFDIIYPGQLPMSKVNWAAKASHEYIPNYKLMQTVMTKNHIDKFVDVDRLIKGRYQDNLEFMQWLKAFYEMQGVPSEGYDAVGQRAKGKGGSQYALAQGKSGGAAAPRPTSAPVAKQRPVVAVPQKVEKPLVAMKENKPNAPVPAPTKTTATKAVVSKVASQETPKLKAASASSNAVAQASIDQLKGSNDQLSKAMSEMRLEMDGLEKERDFYFEKLRQVEIIMQELEDAGKGNDLTASVFKILYATADGFEQLETVEAPVTEEVVDEETPVAEIDFVLENSAVEAM